MTIIGNSPREPSSAPRSMGSGAAISGQVLLVAEGLKVSLSGALDPAFAQVVAYGLALLWGSLMGAVGKVCRDRLHQIEAGRLHLSAIEEILVNVGALLG